MINYQLYLPKFFVFIQHHYERYLYNLEDPGESIIGNLFIATLRGIMDSMYNEFLYYRNPLHISKFCDFVYSWLGNYEIDGKSR